MRKNKRSFPGTSGDADPLFFQIYPLEWLQRQTRVGEGVGNRVGGWGQGPVEDRPYRNYHYQLVWIIEGSGHYRIDMEDHELSDNTLYFIPAGMLQHFSSMGRAAGHVLVFSNDFLHLATAGPAKGIYQELLGAVYKVSKFTLKELTTEAAMKNILDQMIKELNVINAYRMEVLSGLLKVFLIYLQRGSVRLSQASESGQKVALFNNFHSHVEEHFLTKRQVAEYASELLVSPNYLTDVVKKVSGFSASYHIQQRMVLEAKRLALYSDGNMKVIAYQLGFDDLSHFSKFFKNAAGITFSGFKKKVAMK